MNSIRMIDDKGEKGGKGKPRGSGGNDPGGDTGRGRGNGSKGGNHTPGSGSGDRAGQVRKWSKGVKVEEMEGLTSAIGRRISS